MISSAKESGGEKTKTQRFMSFQGIGKHLSVVREQKERIKNAEERIGKIKEKIDERIAEFRKQTGQKELFDAKSSVQQVLDALMKEKSAMGAELREINQNLRTLMQSVGEEKKKLNMKSATELRNKIQNIDNRIRESPISSKEEKALSAEKNRIIKLLSMQDIFKEKDEKIKEMEDIKKTKDAAFSVKKQEIENQQKKLTEINNKINKLKKTAFPEDIKKMQEEVLQLIEEKKEALESKKKEMAIMDEKSKEYEKKAEEMERIRQIKQALDTQRDIIAALIKEKGDYEDNLHKSNPCEQLNSLKSALQRQKSFVSKNVKTNISLPFHLVSQLIQFNIHIPTVSSDIEKTIEKIDHIFNKEEKAFEKHKADLLERINTLQEKIREEKKKLDGMPRPPSN